MNNNNPKKIYYFEIIQNSIQKELEKEYMLLYPEFMAHNSVFLESDSLTDKFYLINSLSFINTFIKKLEELSIVFNFNDKTDKFINNDDILSSYETQRIMKIFLNNS
ncbi:hypothetical protein [Flavobacterium aciduliphilum]|uniref:Uncharacterized protein n=1 Tax=Flavobacterium aciduliphilum TaxID=1101402 RepID=A0A328YJN9_9FLAO|nr:hypothetical protein [Flavobacterium aciduliphilum]RAR73750.1 hypothetical protein CLV55_10369 [Flavobacterium aciduliphilum]